MPTVYRNDRFGLYTEIDIPQNQEVINVPEGWVGFNGTWEEAQDEGLQFMGHMQAGFTLGQKGEQ